MMKGICLSAFLASFLIVGSAFADDPYLSKSPSQPGIPQGTYRHATGYRNPNQRMRSINGTEGPSGSSNSAIWDQKQRARDERNAEQQQQRQRQEYEKQKKEIEEYNAKVRQHNAEVAEHNARMQAEAQRQRQQGSSSQSAHSTGDSNSKPYLWDEHEGNLPAWMKSPVERGWDRASDNNAVDPVTRQRRGY